ncbi:hypothetical protein BD324DRAFT_624226 [Kockovaella imperatae]|uniref:Uncharacterized protein n=1 Tax=Kockovaella imperatae TaxID=4999 RepID=A0A1Y1UJ71_9TREE|nr:hypothetical protein BD324DRAFT_624226 [Kockovaella imperatae]ORX38019.1 hypothetical protein BD324DRAFT_624226 [Kockovaella imperatae]
MRDLDWQRSRCRVRPRKLGLNSKDCTTRSSRILQSIHRIATRYCERSQRARMCSTRDCQRGLVSTCSDQQSTPVNSSETILRYHRLLLRSISVHISITPPSLLVSLDGTCRSVTRRRGDLYPAKEIGRPTDRPTDPSPGFGNVGLRIHIHPR